MLLLFIIFEPNFNLIDMGKDKDLNRIKVVLLEKHLTSKWLAEQLNVTEITVSRWTSNKRQPHLEQLFAIANVINVSPRELINDPQSLQNNI